LFPKVKGINGGSEMLNEMMVSYDTRNSLNVPTTGGLITATAGVVDRAFLSSSSYDSFSIDVRRYYRLTQRITLAGQVYSRYVPAGKETPFWAISWLGGDGPGESSLLGLPVSDEQTWRGAGAGRFIDNNMFVANLEVRTRVFELNLFDTHGILELAPFLDLGRVYHSADGVPFAHLHPAGGMGFRAIALPFVVAYVDVGYGPDGSAIFSGINYPF
ncbi:MAG: BamA/TamA family outer membrane protein, partial [Terriglobia bacterium]